MIEYINSFTNVYKILKKIEEGKVYTYNINIIFEEKEINIIKLLYEQGYIFNSIDINNEKENISLTNRGIMCIFVYEHKKEINNFKNTLTLFNYDISFIFDFLSTRCYNNDINKILSLKDYEYFLEDREEEIYNPVIKRKNMSK